MTDLDLHLLVNMSESGRTQTHVVPKRILDTRRGRVMIRISGARGRSAEEAIREGGTRLAAAKTFQAVTPGDPYWIVHSDELQDIANQWASGLPWLQGDRYIRPTYDSIGRDIVLSFGESEWAGAASTTWEAEWELVSDWKPRGGGQGTVRKVRRKSDGVIGALKVLHAEGLTNSERRYRVHRETESLRFMEGIGAPAVLDSNSHEYRVKGLPLYVVTRFTEGPTLKEFIANTGPLSISAAISLSRRIAATLERFHTIGTHRDLKPDNIILEHGDPERIVVVDFGMASANEVNGDDFETAGDQELGNRFLRLPEFSAGRHDWDARSDITFLVGLLFFTTTGKVPRALQDSRGREPHQVLDEQTVAALTRDPTWSRLCDLVFTPGFSYRIDLRFQDLGQIRAAFDRVLRSSHDDTRTEGVDRLRAVMTSREAQEREALEQEMVAASREFLDEIHRALRDTRCSAGGNGPNVSRSGDVIVQFFAVGRNPEPKVYFDHKIAIERDGLVGTYSVEDGSKVEYYRGPPGDTDGLKEAARIAGRRAVNEIAECLSEKLSQSFGNDPPL